MVIISGFIIKTKWDNNITSRKNILKTPLAFLAIISPNHNFKQNLIDFMDKCPLLQEKEMGFPDKWRQEPLWN